VQQLPGLQVPAQQTWPVPQSVFEVQAAHW
jgi:hypothetical protein